MKQLTFGWLCMQRIRNLNLAMCSWSFAVFAAKSSALLLLIWCYHWWKSRVVAECLFIQEFDAVKCNWVCRDLVWFQWILWSTQREHCLHCTDVSPTELLWENAIWNINVNVTLQRICVGDQLPMLRVCYIAEKEQTLPVVLQNNILQWEFHHFSFLGL